LGEYEAAMIACVLRTPDHALFSGEYEAAMNLCGTVLATDGTWLRRRVSNPRPGG
jgi:hypothetical protein